jgi:hypothetical protein
MYTIGSALLQVSVLDPVADRERFGTRYCTGGYIFQVTDSRLGPLLSGPTYPDAFNCFDGQGIPDAFHLSPLRPKDAAAPALVIGIGTCDLTANQVVEFASWEVEASPSRLVLRTVGALEANGYRLERTVAVRERTVHAGVRLANTGQSMIPLRWYPHPFFPQPVSDELCLLNVPLALGEHPAAADQPARQGRAPVGVPIDHGDRRVVRVVRQARVLFGEGFDAELGARGQSVGQAQHPVGGARGVEAPIARILSHEGQRQGLVVYPVGRVEVGLRAEATGQTQPRSPVALTSVPVVVIAHAGPGPHPLAQGLLHAQVRTRLVGPNLLSEPQLGHLDPQAVGVGGREQLIPRELVLGNQPPGKVASRAQPQVVVAVQHRLPLYRVVGEERLVGQAIFRVTGVPGVAVRQRGAAVPAAAPQPPPARSDDGLIVVRHSVVVDLLGIRRLDLDVVGPTQT